MMNGLEGPGRAPGVANMNAEERQYRLKWNNFQSTIATALEGCYTKEEFVDVTLCAESRSVKAHRVLLSACSPYFKSIFMALDNRDHPVIFLRDTPFDDLLALINFIYHGEVCVIQERLSALFKLAQMLEIKGLASDNRQDEMNGNANRSPDGNVIDCIDILDRLTAVKASEMPGSMPDENTVSSVPIETLPHLDLPLSSQTRHVSPSSHNRHASPISHRNQMSPNSHKGRVSPAKKRFSPPSKKRKILNSPQVQQMLAGRGSPSHGSAITPGHTPPNRTPPRCSSVPNTSRDTLRMLQRTPPHTLHHHHQAMPSSSSSNEEDPRVVNLSINNGASSPERVYPKLEYDDGPANESGRDSEAEGSERPPQGMPGEECDVNSTCQDMPLLSHMSLQRYEQYPPQLDLAGPSRMLSGASPAAWRSSVSLQEPPDTQDSHPVFNELFGEGTSGGAKKAVPTPCPVCRKVLSNAYNMRVHLETHQDTTYKCIVCGIVTRTKDTMRKHCSNVHQLRNVEFKKSFKIISGKAAGDAGASPSEKLTPKKRFNPYGSLAQISGLLKPKTEPILTPPTTAASDRGETMNLAKGLAEIRNLLTPKMEAPIPNPAALATSEGLEAMNLAKGSSLASIVSKLSQKQ